MESKFIIEGIKLFETYFGQTYHQESIKAAVAELKNEPDLAMVNAHKRLYVEFSARPAQSMKRVIELIKEEGRKHRATMAANHEQDWEEKKKAESRTPLNDLTVAQRTEYGKRAATIFQMVMAKIDVKEIYEGCRIMARTYSHLPGVAEEWMETAKYYKQKAGGELSN